MVRSREISAQDAGDQEDVAILITSRYFGQGDEELGRILMRSFLYTVRLNGG